MVTRVSPDFIFEDGGTITKFRFKESDAYGGIGGCHVLRLRWREWLACHKQEVSVAILAITNLVLTSVASLHVLACLNCGLNLVAHC